MKRKSRKGVPLLALTSSEPLKLWKGILVSLLVTAVLVSALTLGGPVLTDVFVQHNRLAHLTTDERLDVTKFVNGWAVNLMIGTAGILGVLFAIARYQSDRQSARLIGSGQQHALLLKSIDLLASHEGECPRVETRVAALHILADLCRPFLESDAKGEVETNPERGWSRLILDLLSADLRSGSIPATPGVRRQDTEDSLILLNRIVNRTSWSADLSGSYFYRVNLAPGNGPVERFRSWSKIDLRSTGWEECSLARLNFSGIGIERACFLGSPLHRLSLEETIFPPNLSGCVLKECDLRTTRFALNTNLSGAILVNCEFGDIGWIDFSNATLVGVSFMGAKLSEVRFTKTTLIKVRFHGVTFSNVDFSDCTRRDVTFDGSDLTGTTGLRPFNASITAPSKNWTI